MEHSNPKTLTVSYAEGEASLQLPISGDLGKLLDLQEVREVIVHGSPLLINASSIDDYLALEEGGIHTEEELGELLEKQLSAEDVKKIYNQQMHKKLVGQEFSVAELGTLAPAPTKEMTLIVPRIKLKVDIIEKTIEAIENDDLSKYVTFLPPTSPEDSLKPIRCVTGNTLRTFLNEMQTEDGGLDMNSQILIYAKLLTSLEDDDPTKKYALMQLRSLMVFGDNVSNKGLRLALTKMIEEE